MSKKGLFLVFEGLDGSGTTTQIKLLESFLRKKNVSCVVTGEPTDKKIGKLIREFLKVNESHENRFFQNMLALLFAADRLHHYSTLIKREVNAGSVVISDRYVFSSIAYQSVFCDRDWVKVINRYAPMPDVLIYLRVSPETAIKRVKIRGEEKEIYEKLKVQKSVFQNYEFLMEELKKSKELKLVVLDGEKSVEQVHSEVVSSLSEIFNTQNDL